MATQGYKTHTNVLAYNEIQRVCDQLQSQSTARCTPHAVVDELLGPHSKPAVGDPGGEVRLWVVTV